MASAAETRSPTLDEMRAVAAEPAALTPLLVQWLDAYPESARRWSAADRAFVVAHVVRWDLAHHPTAVAAAEDLVRRRLAATATRLEDVAEALSLASRIRLKRGEHAAAADLLRQGGELCEGAIESRAAATSCAFLLRDLAILSLRQANPGESARALALAMAWLEGYPRSDAWVAVLNSAADLACWRGEVDTCLRTYRRAVLVAERLHGVDSEVAAYGYLGVGWAAASKGDWGEARASFERAERIWSEQLGPDHPRLADALIEYGELLHRSGDPRSAVAVLRRAVELRTSRLGPEAFDLPRALDPLGLALVALGDFDAAEEVLQRSARIRRRTLPSNHVDHARSWAALADLGWAREDQDGARRTLSRALELRLAALGDQDPAVAETYLQMAEAHVESHPERALEWAIRARDPLASAYGRDHPLIARSWWLEARALLRRSPEVGDSLPGDPVVSALRAEAIARDHLRRVAAGFSERDLLDYAAVLPQGADVALDALLAEANPSRARIAAVWQSVARSRGLVFESLSARRRWESDGDVSQELTAARRALAHWLVVGPDDDAAESARRLEAARERVETEERALGLVSGSSPDEPLHLLAVLKHLSPGESLVAYRSFDSRSGRRLAAFVAEGGSALPSVSDLGPWAPIEENLGRWRQAFLGGSEPDYRRVASELRGRIWDPLPGGAHASRRVFIVPEGPLFLLSFAALPSPQGYWVEEDPSILILGAERDLRKSADGAPRRGRVLIVGGPDFGEPASASGSPENQRPPRRVPMNFAPLPHALEEARWVEEAWRRWDPGIEVESLTGVSADERAWRQRAPGTLALHLATHGFFLDGGPRPSPRERWPHRGVGGLSRAMDQTIAPPPAPVSGFALAGANRRAREDDREDGREDGIVTLDEIRSLDLSPTRLVVLSFCDSGLGEISTGEGIFGFTRAFRGAGVESLVLAVAPISDQDSSQFAQRFYDAWLGEGLAIDQALRHASRALLEARRHAGLDLHPVHWGAMIAVGSTLETSSPQGGPPED